MRSRRSWVAFGLVIALALPLAFGCSKQPDLRQTTLAPVYEDRLSSPGRQLNNPRKVMGKATVFVDVEEVLNGRELTAANNHRQIDAQTPPYVQSWMALAPTTGGQTDVKITFTDESPIRHYYTAEPRNSVAYWFVRAKPKKLVKVSYGFEYTASEVNFVVDPAQVGTYDTDNPDYQLFTRSEYAIEVTDYVRNRALHIVGDETNPYLQAKAIFDWVRHNMTYVYPPKARGNLVSLGTKSGDCGEFSFVFASLCRSVGIPARVVFGGWSTPGKFGWHAWAECYIPSYGWLPSDPTVAQSVAINKSVADYYGISADPEYYFGNLDNQRLIFSVGTNIPLEQEPDPMPLEAETPRFYMQPDFTATWGVPSKTRTWLDIETR